MNIIEAIQAAENGKLITNNIMKLTNSYLWYVGRGLFYKYEIVNNKPKYRFEVRNFTMGECINIGWEAIDNNFFKK